MRISTLQLAAACCGEGRRRGTLSLVSQYGQDYAGVCCSVLQCVAVCCSVLQFDAVCCSVLQCVVVCCSVLQCVGKEHCFLSATMDKTMQVCVALCCSELQCVAERRGRTSCSCQPVWTRLCRSVAVCCGVLQCVAVCCSVLQCVAVSCSILQCVTVHGGRTTFCCKPV